MSGDAVLINVGRAPVVAEEDLYNALRNKQIGGAFIDVWYGYPTPEDPERKPSRYPIWELDNVIMTPHCSSAVMVARTAVDDGAAADRLAKRALENVAFQVLLNHWTIPSADCFSRRTNSIVRRRSCIRQSVSI